MARSGPPPPVPRLEHPGIRVAAVVAGYHTEISERLLRGVHDRLLEAGLNEGNLEDHWVPGAFELPLAAHAMAHRRRYAAIVALGVVVRGETAHFDYICSAAANGLTSVGIATGIPVTFGVLTCDTYEQAEARAGGEKGNAGVDAADAAIVMVNLLADTR